MASGGDECLSAISGATLEKAKTELFEDPETRGELVSQLRDKINSWTPSPEDEDEQAITFVRKDDKFLLRFLRTKKFEVDRSLQLYVNYYKYRHKYQHLLGEMTAKSIERVLRSGIISVLPPRIGPRILVVRASRMDLEWMVPGDILKTVLSVLDKVVEDEETQVHGIMVVEDLDGFSFLDTMKVAGNEAVRKGVMMELIQESFPARFKGINFVNQPWYFSLVFSIIRPFMKQKLRERVQVHGYDFESLCGVIPADSLPQEYSGSLSVTDDYCAVNLFQEELENTSGEQAEV